MIDLDRIVGRNDGQPIEDRSEGLEGVSDVAGREPPESELSRNELRTQQQIWEQEVSASKKRDGRESAKMKATPRIRDTISR